MCFGSHFAFVAQPVSNGQTVELTANFGSFRNWCGRAIPVRLVPVSRRMPGSLTARAATRDESGSLVDPYDGCGPGKPIDDE
jgi:hypothetical protein